MTRRVGEPVEVRVVGGDDATPTAFLWRNRLYVVREVLGHWHERGDWWAGRAARAVHGDEMVAEAGGGVAVLDQERELWRVEASPGQVFGTGVYDLSRTVPGSGCGAAQERAEWRLARVTD
jgi:uncharacterized protein DUF6504